MQARQFDASALVDVELEERGRRLDPAFHVHHVREDGHDPVRARGHPGRRLLHDHVWVDPAAAGLGDLQLAEGVAEPAHGDPAIEPDPLGHPPAGDSVAQRPDARLRVDERRIRHRGQLPETAADEGQPIGRRHPDPDQPELRVGAADDHRRPGGEARLVGGAMR